MTSACGRESASCGAKHDGLPLWPPGKLFEPSTAIATRRGDCLGRKHNSRSIAPRKPRLNPRDRLNLLNPVRSRLCYPNPCLHCPRPGLQQDMSMSGASAPDGDRTKVAQGRVRPAGRGAGSSASLLLGGGLSIVASTYGRRKGRLLCEQARAEACGLPLQRVRPPKPLGLTMLWADRIPRPARAAQGFHHVKDFARSVKELRARRAELQRQHPDPVRRAILDTLERILSDREDLREAARRQARAR